MSRDKQSAGKTKQELDRVVFIGRTFEEYNNMFDLHMEELIGKRILDCPGERVRSPHTVRGLDSILPQAI